MLHSFISTEILRICRARFLYNNFLSKIYRLLSCIMKQGAEINICKALSKMIFRHTEGFLKFNIKQEFIINGITS